MWTVHWKDKESGKSHGRSSPFSRKEWAERESENPPKDFLELDYIEEHTDMSKYKVGDLVKVLHSDWPHLIPDGSVKKVEHLHSRGDGVYLGSTEGELLFYDSEVEPDWSVADVTVGDRVKVTRVLEGRVDYVYSDGDFEVDGLMIGADNPTTTVELIEAKPAPKVGDGFTPGLPVGTVLQAIGHPENLQFRGKNGWLGSEGGFNGEDSDWNPNVWKIIYLPEVN